MGGVKVCLAVLMAIVAVPALAQGGLDPSEYYRLHKHSVQALRAGDLQRLRDATNDLNGGFVLAATLSAGAFEDLDRSVGRLDILYEANGIPVRSSFCTATAIARFLVTAAHCVPGQPPGRATRVRFTSTYYSDAISVDDRREHVLSNDSIKYDGSLDFGLIKLPSDSVRAQSFSFRAPLDNETIYFVSHPLGYGKRLSVGTCKVRTVGRPQFLHSCSSLEGSSGALLFAKSDRAIIGMHVQGGLSSGTATNIIDIVEKIPELAETLRRAPQPAQVDTTGWPLSERSFAEIIQRGFASAKAAAVVTAILSERSTPRMIDGKSLIRHAVLAGSLQALEALDTRRYSIPESEKRLLFWDAIRVVNSGRADTRLLAKVLELGATVVPDQGGVLPGCSLENIPAVQTFLNSRKLGC